jgi:hypothetical protein
MDSKALQKIIKSGKKSETPTTLSDFLHKALFEIATNKNERELGFLISYYGLDNKRLTLDEIGQNQEKKITRERVRQIINHVIDLIKSKKSEHKNVFEITKEHFERVKGKKNFIKLDDLISDQFFVSFKNNTHGLIALFNDCGIRQINYRKKYYFYNDSSDKVKITTEIQVENKILRKEKTELNSLLKSKTVTYVPLEIRSKLALDAKQNDISLNALYEIIMNSYIKEKPYMDKEYDFFKTKAWKARNGKADWSQIGIYINIDTFKKMKQIKEEIQKLFNKKVSVMSLICQSFVLYYSKKNLSQK